MYASSLCPIPYRKRASLMYLNLFPAEQNQREKGMDIEMESEKKDRRIRRTKKQLEEALLQLLKTKSIHDISVSELSAAADITRATFYTHYRDPYDMLQQLQGLLLEDILQLIHDTTGRDPKLFFLQLFTYLSAEVEHPELLFLSCDHGSAFEWFGNTILENYMLQWISTTEADRRDYEYYRSYTIFGCIAVIRRWLSTGCVETPEEMSELAIQLLPQGRSHIVQIR